MKKIYLSVLSLFVSIITLAQSHCDDAYLITNLPFNAYSVNTNLADKDTTAKYCGSSFDHGNDTMFVFTPQNDMLIDIELKNVQIPINAMVNFYLLDSCIDNNYQCIAQGINGNFLIENANIQAGHTYYILVTNILYSGINGFIFDMEVREHYSHDLKFIEVNEPRSTCELGSNHEVSFDIKNAGNSSAYNFSVKVIVNGNEQTIDFTDTLAPGEEHINFPFEYYDLTLPENSITGIIIYPSDQNNSNDTIHVITHNLGWENTFPYFDDFEDIGNTKWITEWEYHSKPQTSWEVGQPNANIINYAASGNNAYVTNLSDNAGVIEKSFLIGPCFDFSSLSHPVLEFDMWKQLGDFAHVYMEYNDTETDNWHLLEDNGTAENWYDPIYGQTNSSWIGNSDGWIHAKIRLDEFANKSQVRFRFIYSNNTNTPVEGIAIDNIKISQASNADIGISQILNPVSSCNLSNDSIKVIIKNFSPDSSHTNFPIQYKINDTYTYTDTVRQIIQALDSIVYTFNDLYQFTANNLYKISVSTMLENDDDIANDQKIIKIFKFSNNDTYPFYDDFENTQTWYPDGINSSWQMGTPNDSVINNAFSGQNIWATNLNGYHNEPEQSYVTSPCFDLSQIKNPYVKFYTIYDLFLSSGVTSSYVQFQYSTNGNSWTTLGNANQNNWYNAGQAWTGKLNNWTEKKHSLAELNNSTHAQFRFKLYALQAKTGFGFDDFTICDAPIAGFYYETSDSSVVFYDTSYSAINHKWVIDGEIVSEQNQFSFTTDKDSIIVIKYSSNNCDTDSITKIVYLTGIKNIANTGNIKIYPNPAKDFIYISSLNKNINIVNIVIYNVNSKKVKSIKSFNIKNDKSIDVKELNKGIYILRTKYKNTIVYNKFVKF